MLPGKGSVVGERFVTHPAVRKVCFTGSTEVGKRIMAGCAEQVKRVTLELGGKSANIVFADADLAKAAAARAGRGLRQRRAGLLRPVPDPGAAPACTTAFLELLERAVTGVPVRGPGAGARAEMGPLISAGAAGLGRVLCGRRRGGVHAAPPRTARASGTRRRCCSRTRPGDRHWREEIFGPVALGAAVRRRGRRDPAGQRHRVRPVRLDLDPRPRPGDPGGPRRRDRQPERQLQLVGALLDAVRRREAVRPRPRARPRRAAAFTEVKNVFFSSES